jgi:hypothetical protein
MVKWLKGVLESRGVKDETLMAQLELAAPVLVVALMAKQPGPDLLSGGVAFRVVVKEDGKVEVEPFIDGKELGAQELLTTVGDHSQQMLIGALRKFMDT